jgi:Zn-dependent protease
MLRSWKLGTIRGIGVHIHWTFWLLMLFYTLTSAAAGGWGAGLLTAALVAALFACVVAHEFGHAFAAAAFGIRTYDITLLPIGGVARLERIPEKPLHELIIAVAGPAVNVVIALLLLAPLSLLQLAGSENNPWMLVTGGFVKDVIAANVVLVLFNLLPAFPMDGGRVLRSLIAMRTSHLRATEIAARVGRWMALLFVIVGFFGQPGLFLVGIFVFLSGTGELMEARRRAMVQSGSRFQWGWSSLDPRSASPHSPSGNLQGDIIDAIEVREIKRAPQSGF